MKIIPDFGQYDPLEIAFLLCHVSQMSQPDEIRTVMDVATSHGAKSLRVPDFGVAVGTMADLVLDARDAREVFCDAVSAPLGDQNGQADR